MEKIKELEENTEWIDDAQLEEYHLNDRDKVRVDRDWGSSDYPWKGDMTKADSKFYPAHYFDYIAGTSTGG
jgi:hypothetical protein